MASGKEIRGKISSVKNTQKITKAMEMVAASKMRRAQDRMSASRPYAEKIREVVLHLAHASSEFNHDFLNEREVKRVGYIVVTTDRGLCGGLNVNLFKATLNSMQEWMDKDVEVDSCVIGSKGSSYFKRITNMVSSVSHLGDKPELDDMLGVIGSMMDAYKNKEIDRLYVVYNRFKNTMSQIPTVTQLIPVQPEKTEEEKKLSYHWDYLYEPDAEQVVSMLLERYVESIVYQSVVENIASEQAARMVAMKSATDNAGSLIDELQTAYNKARQAAITQEISEIVAGAAAV